MQILKRILIVRQIVLVVPKEMYKEQNGELEHFC